MEPHGAAGPCSRSTNSEEWIKIAAGVDRLLFRIFLATVVVMNTLMMIVPPALSQQHLN